MRFATCLCVCCFVGLTGLMLFEVLCLGCSCCVLYVGWVIRVLRVAPCVAFS